MKTFYRNLVSLLLVVLYYNFSFGQVYISEYIEGSSNNKCIEIYNYSGLSVDLSTYSIKVYANGSATPTSSITLSGTLASCGTYVICNSLADPAYTGVSDQLSGSVNFNGDDAVALFDGAAMLDLFGNIGDDPGADWIGVGAGTADDSFIRNFANCTAITTDPSGTGNTSFTSFTAANWTSIGLNGSDLGNHSTSCCASPITIDATVLSSNSFSIDCSTGANGSLDFTSIGEFTVGNNFIVELSDLSGTFSGNNIGSLGLTGTDVTGTINFTVPANTETGSTYCVRITSTTPAATSDTICGITITNTAPCELVGSNPTTSFSITCSTGDNGTIDFASAGTYNAGNTLTVELSNSTGSFLDPDVVGSLSGASAEGVGISGTINTTIPSSLISGSGYCMRIISSDPADTSDAVCGITITNSESCIPPHLTSSIINSCQNGGCSEGHNEIVFGSSGDYSFDVTPANFEMYYGTAATVQTDNYTQSLVTNATTTAVLNDSAGCPGLFVDGTGTTIPPDATFMLVRSTICPDALDWTSLCGQGPIYVIYTTDPTWQASGNFSNSASGMRYFNTVITTTGSDVFDISYDFNSDSLTLHADGDFVTFNPDGGSTTTYQNNGCTIDPVVLNADVINFKGYIRNGESHLLWKTINETNNDYFYIDHSSNGLSWDIIGRVKGNGTTTASKTFEIIDYIPTPGVNYYRLHAVDLDGSIRIKGIISLKYEIDFAHYNTVTSIIELSYKTDIEILSTDGRVITRNFNVDAIPFDKKGIFLIRDLRNSLVQRIYID